MKRLIGRLYAAFNVLTSTRFVVIVYNKPYIDSYSNVSREAFRAMANCADKAFEHQDEQETAESALKQAKELLK